MSCRLIGMVAVLLLVGCGERAQTSVVRKADAQAWSGTGNDPYTVTGWKAGDAASWEQQMRNRAVYGQNEYARSTAGAAP